LTFYWWFESVILFGKMYGTNNIKTFFFLFWNWTSHFYRDIKTIKSNSCFSFAFRFASHAIHLSHLQPIKIHNMFAVIKHNTRPFVQFHPLSKRQIFAYYLAFNLATHAIYHCHLQTVILGVLNIFMKSEQNKLQFILFSPKNNTHSFKLESHVGYSLSFIKFWSTLSHLNTSYIFYIDIYFLILISRLFTDPPKTYTGISTNLDRCSFGSSYCLFDWLH
jgi:hypothetical protein